MQSQNFRCPRTRNKKVQNLDKAKPQGLAESKLSLSKRQEKRGKGYPEKHTESRFKDVLLSMFAEFNSLSFWRVALWTV